MLSWDHLESLFPQENKIDCQSCSTTLERQEFIDPKLKCCTFQPFWSAFFAGFWLENNSHLKKGSHFLPVGICPAPSVRQKQYSMKEQFSKNSDLLCSYFEKSTGGCEIWQQRPMVCRTYYCASEYGDKGLRYYQDLESNWNMLEGRFLYQFLMERGYSLEEWSLLVEYLDERGFERELPDHLILQEAEAQELYSAAAVWLRDQPLKEWWPQKWNCANSLTNE